MYPWRRKRHAPQLVVLAAWSKDGTALRLHHSQVSFISIWSVAKKLLGSGVQRIDVYPGTWSLDQQCIVWEDNALASSVACPFIPPPQDSCVEVWPAWKAPPKRERRASLLDGLDAPPKRPRRSAPGTGNVVIRPPAADPEGVEETASDESATTDEAPGPS